MSAYHVIPELIHPTVKQSLQTHIEDATASLSDSTYLGGQETLYEASGYSSTPFGDSFQEIVGF